MEGLARLVSESLARHGLNPLVDHRRLQWSRWFRCESSHSLLLVPSLPGIFALAEEVLASGETALTDGKRMLAVLQFCEAEDMAFVLDRMLSPANPMRNRLASGRCFVRYVVIADASQRRSYCHALNQWLASSAAAMGATADFASSLELIPAAEGMPRVSAMAPPERASSATVVRGSAVPDDQENAPQQDAGVTTGICRPQPLPSGF